MWPSQASIHMSALCCWTRALWRSPLLRTPVRIHFGYLIAKKFYCLGNLELIVVTVNWDVPKKSLYLEKKHYTVICVSFLLPSGRNKQFRLNVCNFIDVTTFTQHSTTFLCDLMMSKCWTSSFQCSFVCWHGWNQQINSLIWLDLWCLYIG